MKKTKTIAVGCASILLFASPVYALGVSMKSEADIAAKAAGASTTVKAKAEAKIEAAGQNRLEKGKDRGEKEIDRRVTILNDLSARVQAMVRLSADTKASIAASIQGQISALSNLKAKIAADTEIDALKADVKSITESYRIFSLVIPQGHIIVAADKLTFVATNANTIVGKLSARIDAAAAAGKDVAALKTKLAEMQTKISDATTQADAAVTAVAALSPDNGDKTKAQTNTQTLKDARAKIKEGLQDMVTVKADAHAIVKALAKFNLDGSASSTSTVTP